jgi:hypothetical protein
MFFKWRFAPAYASNVKSVYTASCGVRTHAQLPAVDLKSTPLTTRANLPQVFNRSGQIIQQVPAKCRSRMLQIIMFWQIPPLSHRGARRDRVRNEHATHKRPCGLMDKALVFGTKDCRFESCQGHHVVRAAVVFSVRCAKDLPSGCCVLRLCPT